MAAEPKARAQAFRAPRALPSACRIAVLVPCRNEADCIAKVVRDFQNALPTATVYVWDNDSTDGSAELAAAAGAVVRRESLRGKGNVVRRMFADVEADVYVLVDGDDTYDHTRASELADILQRDGLDMVVGARVAASEAAYRPGHRLGNYLLTRIVNVAFGNRVSDMLSGYRVFSRRFVKSFPALTSGFEIETELTVHALELRMPIAEVPTAYRARPPSSASKLNTLRDGWRILRTIVLLVKEERPLPFFGSLFLMLSATSIVLAWPLLTTFLETGLVPRFPTAVLSTGLMLLAFLCLASGVILDTVTRGRREMKRLHYLAVPGVSAHEPPPD
jgi:glycosyltransferase involved in cell wall biosynthesis